MMHGITLCGRSLPAVAVFVAMLFLPANADAPGEGDTVAVALDQATVLKVPDRVATIVIGNPLIADVSLQAGGLMVVTGKGYGVTNLIALDRSGAMLLEKSVQVKGPRGDVVVVYRGVERESYDCAPKCERRNTLGDAQTYFDSTLAQTVTRASQAQGLSQESK